MTESEWLASEDPGAMLAHLRSGYTGIYHGVSDRKLRLFACACCRQIWGRLTDAQHVSVVFAEQEPWHRSALGGVHPEYLSQDAITTYTGSVGDGRSINNAVRWLGAASAREVAEQSPAWLQRVMLFQTQAAILRDIVGDPFRETPGALAVPGKHVCESCGCLLLGAVVVCFRCGEKDRLRKYRRIEDCLTPDVLALAAAAYEERAGRTCGTCDGWTTAPDSEGRWRKCKPCGGTGRIEDGTLDPARLAVLSDALEEAGCEDGRDHLLYQTGDRDAPESLKDGSGEVALGMCRRCRKAERELESPCDGILAHLRSPGPHYRGCWALDLILGRE